MSCAHQPTDQFAPIGEGLCPRCAEPLRRDGEFGRCPCCKWGWALTPTEVRFAAPIPNRRAS